MSNESGVFPTDAKDLNTASLNTLIQTLHPDVTVDQFSIIKELSFGDGSEPVSTAGRVEVALSYQGQGSETLPKQLIIKVCRPDIAPRPLYRNEVAFYTRLRPELDIEAPVCIGGMFDENTASFGLALEDLRVRGVSFPNVTTSPGVAHIKAVLSQLAKLHATFWNSDKFYRELDWIKPHTEGELYELFNHPDLVPAVIQAEVDNNQFKRELVQGVGQTPQALYQQLRTVQQHQATLTPTLCHGDTHVGNTYARPDGGAGLYDWQLMARGYCMHDVSYVIITGLSVEERRANEKDLIHFYLAELASNGVALPPSFEQAFLEYRHAAVWCFYIGWLTTPIDNYGWDITVCNHIRLATAYRDLETAAAVAQLPTGAAYS